MRRLIGACDELICPIAGRCSADGRGYDSGGNSAEVLDQSLPHHDGDGPQLAQCQWPSSLVSRDKIPQPSDINPSVDV